MKNLNRFLPLILIAYSNFAFAYGFPLHEIASEVLLCKIQTSVGVQTEITFRQRLQEQQEPGHPPIDRRHSVWLLERFNQNPLAQFIVADADRLRFNRNEGINNTPFKLIPSQSLTVSAITPRLPLSSQLELFHSGHYILNHHDDLIAEYTPENPRGNFYAIQMSAEIDLKQQTTTQFQISGLMKYLVMTNVTSSGASEFAKPEISFNGTCNSIVQKQ